MLYMIKFSSPLGGPKHQASLYLGYCAEGRLDKRLKEHKAGRGAAITRAAVLKGFSLEIVRVWPNLTRKDERIFKNRKNHSKLLLSA